MQLITLDSTEECKLTEFHKIKKHLQSLDDYGEMRTENRISDAVYFEDKELTVLPPIIERGINCRVFKNGSWGMAYHDLNHDSNHIGNSDLFLEKVLKYALSNAEILSSHIMPKRKYNIPFEDHSLSKSLIMEKTVINKDYLTEIIHFFNDYINRSYPKLENVRLSAVLEWGEKEIITSTKTDFFSARPEITFFVRMDLGGYSLTESFYGQADSVLLLDRHETIIKSIDNLYEQLVNKQNAISIEKTTALCILSPKVASQLIHKTIGHQAEADFIYSNQPNATIMQLPKLHKAINIVDYANTAFGKPCPTPVHVDDEGVIAKDVNIITDGKINYFMVNRETAYLLNLPPTGNARASGYRDEPLIRMRNTALLPATDIVADMISSVENGYYLLDGQEGFADINGDFAFHVGIGYHIKNGKIAEPLNNCIIWGNGDQFLSSISMVGDDFEWNVSECDKKQKIRLSAGAPTIKACLNIRMEG